jgi:hypothetical protein
MPIPFRLLLLQACLLHLVIRPKEGPALSESCFNPSSSMPAENLLQVTAGVQGRQEHKAAKQASTRRRRSSSGNNNKESLRFPPPPLPRLPASAAWQHSSGLGSGNDDRQGAGMLDAAEGWQVGQAGMAAAAGDHPVNSSSSLAGQLKPVQARDLRAALLRIIPRQAPACM